MTGPLYCCSFMAKRTTEWRLKPLRGSRDQIGRGKGVQEIEDARIDVGFVSARLANGPVEIAAIGIGGRGRAVYIGAINREAGDHLLNCPLQDVLREIRAARVLPGDARSVAGEDVQFARHLLLHDADF